MPNFWKVPKLFPGEVIVCVGGGPSLKDFDPEPLRRAGVRVIGVNNASFGLVPWCDIIFFGDRRWWRWYSDKIKPEATTRIITASCAVFNDGRILRVNKDYKQVLSHDPTSVVGIDSGTMAINLAYHLGARKIVLLGYDMGFTEGGECHWHEPHRDESGNIVKSIEKNYLEKFAPQIPPMLAELKKLGIEVVRCTPSNLGDAVPMVTLEEALA